MTASPQPIPRRQHGWTDYRYIPGVLAAPRLAGFAGDRRARNTFLATGVVGILAGLLSRPGEMPEGRR